jgi:hypothetical protein
MATATFDSLELSNHEMDLARLQAEARDLKQELGLLQDRDLRGEAVDAKRMEELRAKLNELAERRRHLMDLVNPDVVELPERTMMTEAVDWLLDHKVFVLLAAFCVLMIAGNIMLSERASSSMARVDQRLLDDASEIFSRE